MRGRQPGNVVKARPASDARAKAWTSMRILVRFDTRQLVVTAEIRESNAKDYVARLRAAGYLRALKAAGGNGRPGLYQLVRNSGPLAPITRKTGDVYDQNTKQVYTPGAAKGEANGKASQ